VRESSQLFVVGLAQRGPTNDAVLVQSIAEFENTFGGFVSYSYLHPTVETFFEEGGTQAYVCRVAGETPTTATLALKDATDNTVLTIDANGPGAWGEDVSVQVTNTPTGDLFAVILRYQDEVIYSTGNVSTPAQAAGRINLNPIASRYVVATATPGENTKPAVLVDTNLVGGDDDLDSVSDDSLIAGLEAFNDALGAGAVAIPDGETATRLASGGPVTDYDGTGKAGQDVSAALIAHANANNRIAILHCGAADTPANAIAKSEELKTEEHGEHAALYYPWVSVPTGNAGVFSLIPPDGYVAAKRALAHNQSGAQVPAAGLISSSRFVSGTAADVNKTAGDALDAQNINAIRVIQNSVRVYGARSLSLDTENFRYITTQEIINHIVVEAQRSLEDLVFGVIDGRDTIFSAITSRLIAILAPLREQGAIFQAFDANGKKIDNGYTVRCDSALNPVSQLAGGTVKAKIGVRTSSVGDKIEVDIIKSNLTSSVV
jgi:hypothetical protein